MYGWIVASLESMILNKYGPQQWKLISEMAENPIKTGEFIKNIHYSDDLMFTLINASSKVLNVPQETLMENLGENFINFIKDNGYDSTIRAQGQTFGEFLQNMNEPHRLLRSRFPESYLPEFWCTKIEKNNEESSCVLHYYSQRGTLFAPMVVGLVREVGQLLYAVSCSFEFISQIMEESYVHTVWKVSYCSTPRPPSLPDSGLIQHHHPLSDDPTALTPHRITKCPFTYIRAHSSEHPQVTKKAQIGLSSQRIAKLFPFHIVINQNLELIQFGDQLQDFLQLHSLEKHVYPVHEVFSFQTPPDLTWSWNTILSLQDTCIELVAARLDGNVVFRGNVMILDPQCDPGIEESFAMILLTPVVYSLDEMESIKMRLSDFPNHSFQRDLIVLGQHMIIEQSHAVKLDVLSRKLEEERVKSLNSLKIKRAFVRYVSHEIRSPLNTALLGLRYIGDHMKQTVLNENVIVDETLTEVKNSCSVAVDILNDLLLYEKFDDGIFSLSKNEIKIADYFVDAASVYKIQARASDVSFEIQTKDVDDVIVNVDVTKFSQVLRNLLSNALKFTPKGGKVSAICSVIPMEYKDSNIHFADVPAGIKEQFESKLKDNYGSNPNLGFVRIAVSDNGVGITLTNQKLMFNEFVQFDPDKLQNGQGSGLGLWIASSIMHLHGGRIGVFSEGEGRGTTFIVDIPICKRELSRPPMRLKTMSFSSPMIPHIDVISPRVPKKSQSLRLLIVDDSSMNRKIMKRLLQEQFEVIDEAENGLEATTLCKASHDGHKPYHVVVMDAHMPVMNGLDAASKIKVSCCHSPPVIIGVTGNALKSDIENFLKAGANKVMVKPLNLDEFMNYVGEKFNEFD